MEHPAKRRWLLPTLLAPFLFWALTRLFAHDAALPLIWASSITAWGFLPAYAIVVAAAVRRRPVVAGLGAFVVACHLIWVAPTLVEARAEPPTEAPALRVVTANLLRVNERPDALLDELLGLDADVLVLEEVSPLWAGRLTTARVHARYPHHDLFVRDDAFGIAILSRRPVLRSEVVDLGSVPMIDATVDVDGRAVRVLGVHTLPPVDGGYARVWRAQLDALEAYARTIDGPLVIAGDFNATTHSAPLGALRRAGLRDVHDQLGRGLATTWPNGLFPLPSLRLDHVLVSEQIHPIAVSEGRGQGSDHRPVIADLRIAG